MPQTNEGILFIIGAVFFLIGLLGGGMEISAIKIPPIGKLTRFLVFGMGALLMGVALYRFLSPAGSPAAAQLPENTPTPTIIVPTPTETPLPPTPTSEPPSPTPQPPTPTSVPPTLTSQPVETSTQIAPVGSGRIEDIWVDYDVFQFEQKGMRIHVKFAVDGYKDVSCQIVAYFYFASGEQLVDYNGEYATTGNNVAVYLPFTPVYESAAFSDFQLFMPYSELELADGQYALKFSVYIWDLSSDTTITSSPDVFFDYSQ
jgi:hypothetical protein